MVKKNNKGISPVVATALLLVVAVVAVVGFQNWFQDFNSGVTSNIEKKTSDGSVLTISTLEASETGSDLAVLYVSNTANENVTVLFDGTTIKDSDSKKVCELNGSVDYELEKSKMQGLVFNCSNGGGLLKDSTYQILLVTNKRTYSATKNAK